MVYCTSCGTEYKDGTKVCTECESTELVTADEMRRRGLLLREERDTRRFLRAGTAEDPLAAERYSSVLTAAKIPVFVRPRRTGTVDALTCATPQPWWEILVPEEFCDRASALIVEEQEREESNAAEAARAAEEEELEGEKQGAG